MLPKIDTKKPAARRAEKAPETKTYAREFAVTKKFLASTFAKENGITEAGFKKVFEIKDMADADDVYNKVHAKQKTVRGEGNKDENLDDGIFGEITYGKLSSGEQAALKEGTAVGAAPAAAARAPETAPAAAPSVAPGGKPESPEKDVAKIPTIKERPDGPGDRSPALGNPFTGYTFEAVGSGLHTCEDPEKALVGDLLKVTVNLKLLYSSEEQNDLKAGNLVEVTRAPYQYKGQTVVDVKTSWNKLARVEVKNLEGTDDEDLKTFKETKLAWLKRQKARDEQIDRAALHTRKVVFREDFKLGDETIKKGQVAIVEEKPLQYKIQWGDRAPVYISRAGVELPVDDSKFKNAQWYAKINMTSPITARGEKSHINFELETARNEAVAILKQTESRYLIRTSDGREGWTAKGNISGIVARNGRTANDAIADIDWDGSAKAAAATAATAPKPAEGTKS